MATLLGWHSRWGIEAIHPGKVNAIAFPPLTPPLPINNFFLVKGNVFSYWQVETHITSLSSSIKKNMPHHCISQPISKLSSAAWVITYVHLILFVNWSCSAKWSIAQHRSNIPPKQCVTFSPTGIYQPSKISLLHSRISLQADNLCTTWGAEGFLYTSCGVKENLFTTWGLCVFYWLYRFP